MGIKATTVSYTFTARSLRIPKFPRLSRWPRLSETTRQQVIEQFLAVSASYDAFEAQMQRVADVISMDGGALERLRRQVSGDVASWIIKDDKPRAATAGPPRSPFGWIVDVIAAHPGPKGGYTPLIPRKVETTEAAIERLAISTGWSRGPLRHVAEVLEKSGEFDYWKIPSLVEYVARSWDAGMPVDPHMVIQIVRAFRFSPRKPA